MLYSSFENLVWFCQNNAAPWRKEGFKTAKISLDRKGFKIQFFGTSPKPKFSALGLKLIVTCSIDMYNYGAFVEINKADAKLEI